jgi:AcrR family transcriptional regulator
MLENSTLTLPAPATAAAQEKVRRITDAAATVMGRQGYAATSMKDIAAEAGVAQGLIHYYFESKEALLLAVMHGMCGQMLEECRARFGASTGDPMARSWVALEAARDHCLEHPQMLRLMLEMVTVSLNNPSMRAQLEAMYLEIQATTAEMVSELNNQLPFPMPVPAEDFANVLIAGIDGLAMRAMVDSHFDVHAAYRAFGFLLLSSASAAYAVAGQPLPLESMVQALGITPADFAAVQDNS